MNVPLERARDVWEQAGSFGFMVSSYATASILGAKEQPTTASSVSGGARVKTVRGYAAWHEQPLII